MKKLILIFVLNAFLAGCSGLNFPSVHKIGIQQGNIIDDEMTEQLFIGMSKSQVKYVLGTPVINDTFTLNRWDYSYRYISPNGELEKKSLTLVFNESNALKEIIETL